MGSGERGRKSQSQERRWWLGDCPSFQEIPESRPQPAGTVPVQSPSSFGAFSTNSPAFSLHVCASSFCATFPQMHGPGLALLPHAWRPSSSFSLHPALSALEKMRATCGGDGKIVESFLVPSPEPAPGDKQNGAGFLHTTQDSTQFDA